MGLYGPVSPLRRDPEMAGKDKLDVT